MSAARDFLNAAAPLVSLLAAVLLANRKRVIREFEARRAVTADSAIQLDASGGLKRFWRRKLARDGVLKQTSDGFWLDEAAWSQYRAVRKRRALTIAALALLFVALILIINLRNG